MSAESVLWSRIPQRVELSGLAVVKSRVKRLLTEARLLRAANLYQGRRSDTDNIIMALEVDLAVLEGLS